MITKLALRITESRPASPKNKFLHFTTANTTMEFYALVDISKIISSNVSRSCNHIKLVRQCFMSITITPFSGRRMLFHYVREFISARSCCYKNDSSCRGLVILLSQIKLRQQELWLHAYRNFYLETTA